MTSSPKIKGRVEAPIYSGFVTPAKWFIRGWQHHLDPLLLLNDVDIRRGDAWQSLLLQFLELPGRRTIRWDLKSKSELAPDDFREIVDYVSERSDLDQFLEEQKRADSSTPRLRASLPELEAFERAYGDEEEEFDALSDQAAGQLRLTRSYDTESTVVMVANTLGDKGWDRVYSRLNVFVWDPSVDEQLEDLRTWGSPVVLPAILSIIDACHQRGEVLSLDYRAVLRASEALALAMPWEDPLRASFCTPSDAQVQDDANAVLNWLASKEARADQVFTEREMYQEVGAPCDPRARGPTGRPLLTRWSHGAGSNGSARRPYAGRDAQDGIRECRPES